MTFYLPNPARWKMCERLLIFLCRFSVLYLAFSPPPSVSLQGLKIKTDDTEFFFFFFFPNSKTDELKITLSVLHLARGECASDYIQDALTPAYKIRAAFFPHVSAEHLRRCNSRKSCRSLVCALCLLVSFLSCFDVSVKYLHLPLPKPSLCTLVFTSVRRNQTLSSIN